MTGPKAEEVLEEQAAAAEDFAVVVADVRAVVALEEALAAVEAVASEEIGAIAEIATETAKLQTKRSIGLSLRISRFQ